MNGLPLESIFRVVLCLNVQLFVSCILWIFTTTVLVLSQLPKARVFQLRERYRLEHILSFAGPDAWNFKSCTSWTGWFLLITLFLLPKPAVAASALGNTRHHHRWKVWFSRKAAALKVNSFSCPDISLLWFYMPFSRGVLLPHHNKTALSSTILGIVSCPGVDQVAPV
jgi:hypothetical protein